MKYLDSILVFGLPIAVVAFAVAHKEYKWGRLRLGYFLIASSEASRYRRARHEELIARHADAFSDRERGQ